VTHPLDEFRSHLMAAPFADVIDLWEMIEKHAGPEGKAWLGRNDRFYLLTRLLHRFDAVHPWLYARCREVEQSPDGYLDLWAREHYKSTIITFAGIIQEIARDPEITVAILSFNKSAARKFMFQIKLELETNKELQAVYPDVFWSDPAKQAPRWSLDGGLIVKRKNNPKEATVEGHGLVDGMPTGGHYALLAYDDVVTPESVTSPEMVTKTSNAWSISDNLGARGPNGFKRKWHAGTRYSYQDTYQFIVDRGALKVRLYPATDTGLASGKPVFLSQAAWAELKLSQTDSVLACQQLMDPAAGAQAMFKKEWLKFIDIRPSTLNVYIMCDPAHSKKKDSDNTAFSVVGIDAGNNKYLLDGMRHKMGLRERWEAMRSLRKYWSAQPGVQMVKCGYEAYGMQSDHEYFQEQMLVDKDSFKIHVLNWTSDGTRAKEDRVQRLQPDFKMGKFYLARVCVRSVPATDSEGNELKGADGEPILQKVPFETADQKKVREGGQAFRIFKPVTRKDHEGSLYSLNKGFLDEYLTFPFSAKKDFIDATSRLFDMEPVAPIHIDERALEPEVFADGA
jgi:phage terminase large subunit-like protein